MSKKGWFITLILLKYGIEAIILLVLWLLYKRDGV